MNHTIAMRVDEYYPAIFPAKYIRKRTTECECNALSMLKAYRDFNQISGEIYAQAEREIKSAPHDDAISNIMTKVRKKAKW